ncbi:SLACS-associated protein, putative [Leishmania panamensis]|uniref:SLACS-associated protein, putative n=1 Tax=Leishmania panamensis TaxID=5679 RepID=A0AC62A6M1_LEIPA
MYPDTAEQEEEDTGSAPRSAEPRTETHTPPTQPPGTEGEGEENDTAESANTEPDQTVEDVSQTSDEARHRFHHGENTAAQQTGTIHCPVCPRTWTSRARRQQQTSHLNTTHARGGEGGRAEGHRGRPLPLVRRVRHRVRKRATSTRPEMRRVRHQGGPQPEARPDRAEHTPAGRSGGAHPGDTATTDTPPHQTHGGRRRVGTGVSRHDPDPPETGMGTLGRGGRPHPPRLHRGGRRGTLPAPARAYRAGAHSSRQTARTSAGGGREPPEEPSETPREGGRDEPYTGHAGATRRANTEEHLPTRDAHTAEERRARRILHQLSLGAVGKAARTLFQAQLPRARASEALDQLRTLHPQEDPAGYPCPPQTPFPHGLKPEKVRNVVLKRLGRAAAPGLDGWTRELLVPVVENAALLAETTALMQDILAGNVSASFAFRLRACVVHPFLKEPGSPKVRPITPESVWLKIASHLALDAVEKPFRDIFQGWQFGVWGDAAEAVTQIRETYASESADTLVALDATNAYNRVSRAWVLRAAYRHHALHHTVGVVDLSLGEPGALGVYEGGRRVEQLWSTRGVRQGMVLSPLLFATAVAEHCGRSWRHTRSPK